MCGVIRVARGIALEMGWSVVVVRASQGYAWVECGEWEVNPQEYGTPVLQCDPDGRIGGCGCDVGADSTFRTERGNAMTPLECLILLCFAAVWPLLNLVDSLCRVRRIRRERD